MVFTSTIQNTERREAYAAAAAGPHTAHGTEGIITGNKRPH